MNFFVRSTFSYVEDYCSAVYRRILFHARVSYMIGKEKLLVTATSGLLLVQNRTGTSKSIDCTCLVVHNITKNALKISNFIRELVPV